MSIHIPIDMWIMPLLISVLLIGWAIPRRRNENDSGGYIPDLAYGVGLMVRGALAIIISLTAWLIWALAR